MYLNSPVPLATGSHSGLVVFSRLGIYNKSCIAGFPQRGCFAVLVVPFPFPFLSFPFLSHHLHLLVIRRGFNAVSARVTHPASIEAGNTSVVRYEALIAVLL